MVSSGLGGGSLIYANVLLRKDEHWFTQDIPGRQRPGAVGRDPGRPRSATTTAPSARCGPRPCRSGPTATSCARRRLFATPPPSSARTGASCPLAVRFHNDHQAAGAGRAAGGGAVRQPLRAVPGAPAGSAASATSAATTVPRTPSTTPTCRRPTHAGARLSPLSEVKELERDGDHFVVRYLVHEPPRRPRCQAPPQAHAEAVHRAGEEGGGGGRHLRQHLPAADQRQAARSAERSGPRVEVLGQRRPARLRDEGRPPPRRVDRPGDHVGDAPARQGRHAGPRATSAPTSRTPATRASPTGWWSSAVSAPS